VEREFQVKEAAFRKAQRKRCIWYAQGTERRQVLLERREGEGVIIGTQSWKV
jgi:hypothetical protein